MIEFTSKLPSTASLLSIYDTSSDASDTEKVIEDTTTSTTTDATDSVEISDDLPETSATYTVDIEKVKQMKADSDQRMMELLKKAAISTSGKQAGNVLSLWEDDGDVLEITYTQEDIEKAKEDIAEGGYWSVEVTAERILSFAKAISGGDPEKISILKDAVDEAFSQVSDMFGGELPDITSDTYDSIMSGFDDWAGESNQDS